MPPSPFRRDVSRPTLARARAATALLTSAFFASVGMPAQAAQTADSPAPAAAPQSLATVHDAAQIVSRDDVVVRYVPPFAWPVGATATISDGFGLRVAPTAGASTLHQGVDFAAAEGTPIVAAAPGTVHAVSTEDVGGCGVSATLEHTVRGERFITVYCHLSAGSMRVTTGDTVPVGRVIASVGNTGVSTGAHLHFEVRPGGGAAVDPIAWLQARDPA